MKKPTKIFIDTNVVIRYLVGDNLALCAKATEFFGKVSNGETKALIPESVIAECIFVLTKIYHASRVDAANSLIGVLRFRGIANDDKQEMISSLLLFAEHNLDIVDCILLAKTIAADEALLTFDGDLNRLLDRLR